jgi:hypothetical protein
MNSIKLYEQPFHCFGPEEQASSKCVWEWFAVHLTAIADQFLAFQTLRVDKSCLGGIDDDPSEAV